ncbi:MAG: hypothetical protein ABII07_01950 [Patescibacteria group bacterium]|nr:hypothetical protein [Patescibacteria group bacterium]
MLETLKKLALPATVVGLALTGCPENRTVSEQQGSTREELKCIVLCESDSETGGYSIIHQCRPGIAEDDKEQAKEKAYEAWQKLPEEDRPACPPRAAFGIIAR